MGYINTIQSPSLPLHLRSVLIFIHMYILLFISRDTVLLVSAVSNVFSIMCSASFLHIIHALLSIYQCLNPITSLSSLTLCNVLVDSLGFANVPSYYLHIAPLYNVYYKVFFSFILPDCID